jgi:hypothetical protein
VAVEWEHGARARVFKISHAVLEFAQKEMRKSAAEIAGRIKSGDWSDVQQGPEPLEVPDWMLRKMESA